jgi:glycosyltransferase involved in cell wall biosynthesis
MSDVPKTVFLGLGASVVSYYRCFLPAVVLGAEYATWGQTDDRRLVITGGLGNPPPALEALPDYEVVVIQYATGSGWLSRIRTLQAAGVTVLYEIDDYVHGARKNKQHELSDRFGLERVRDLEMGMRACDGIICTTEYLARRYRSINPRTWVCPNGIDLKRYEWNRPERTGVTIGFAGGVGHKASLVRWIPAIRNVMRARPDVRFVSVGYPAATAFTEEFGPERAIAYPATDLETYPASMTLFDISFAPSAENNQFRGKSDLRWLETGALGIPLVAHPDVYPEIEDGVTGLHARTPQEAEAALLQLVDDAELRERIGRQAHELIAAERRIEVAAERWADVLRQVTGTPAAV